MKYFLLFPKNLAKSETSSNLSEVPKCNPTFNHNNSETVCPICVLRVGHHNSDILTNRLTAVIDMSLLVITAVNHNHLVYQMVTVITGHNRLPL